MHDFQGAAAQYEDVIRHGLDLEAVVKCRQLGVYEPPGLDTAATGTRATLQRLVWRYRCSIEVSGARSCIAGAAVCIHSRWARCWALNVRVTLQGPAFPGGMLASQGLP